MISVRNHPQPSSGNKWFLFVLTAALLAACSPKVRNVPTAAVKKPDTVKQKIVVVKPLPPVVHTSVISLLLPFQLDGLNLSPDADRSNLKKADMAVDYYQGFKMALDSLTALSYNFKLQVFDTKDDNRQLYNLAINQNVRGSDLIVGPVYPENIKYFSSVLTGIKRTIVSPLSPSSPEELANPNLVTVIPPLEYHAWHAADYINRKLKAKKVFILKSGYSEENKYTLPFKKAIDSLSKKSVELVVLTVTRGNLKPIIAQLSATDQNMFLVPSTNQEFLMAVLHSLDTLSKHYPVTLFGHPNWERFAYLKPELLQRLNTYITSTDRINYKSPATIRFVKNYRKNFHQEPTEYAIKGFDEGMVFGNLIAVDKKALQTLDSHDFSTLNNTYHFVYKPGAGWINTHADILKYGNYELRKVE